MKKYKIAVIPGDGIGKEVLPAAIRILDNVAEKCGFKIICQHFDYCCEYFLKTGMMMPKDGLSRLQDHDAIFLGAVGYPGVPDHVSLWGLLIPIRRTFKQYINLRPVKLMEGIESPLRNPGKIDMMIVRENNEGEYSNVGGRLYENTTEELVMQQSIFTRKGTDRVMRYAFDLARKRRMHVTSATKSNGIVHTMPYWDERFKKIAAQYPEVETSQFHIDILAAHFVQHPDWFDVVVASNLFGDILSDLGPALVGGMGLAAGANINPEGTYPSMFEPVHGSAPDIAGKGIANPIACIATGAMMLDHLGEHHAAQLVDKAIETVIRDEQVKTPDLGGGHTTNDMSKAILNALNR